MPWRAKAHANILKRYAEVAELVDAHDSGSCVRKDVEVRVFSSAPVLTSITNDFRWYSPLSPVITRENVGMGR